jgi:hypothetical protein
VHIPGRQEYTLVISPAMAITTTSLPSGVHNMSYMQTIAATGGNGPYTFATTTGTLPTGLTLNASTGVLSGTPTNSNTFTFTIRATDVLGGSASQAYTVMIT